MMELVETKCPICNKQHLTNIRYLTRICDECVDSGIFDKNGERREYFNKNVFGGCIDDLGNEYNIHECYIKGIKCITGESKFGGTVTILWVTNCN